MLDLRRVRVFHEVVARQSFSAAAQALDYTQPTVSHHVSALEAEVGARLLNRTTRPLTLTQAGRILHTAAATGLAEFDRAERELRLLAEGSTGRVALGSVVTGLRAIVPIAARSFCERFPGVELSLKEGRTPDVLLHLRQGELDVGIVATPNPPDVSIFESRLLLEQPLRLALPRDHPLARRNRVELSALDGESWVLPAADHYPELRGYIDALLADAGVNAAAVIESSDVLAGANIVAAGLGVGIVPGLGVIPWPGVVLVPVTPKVARRLYAVTIAGNASTPLRELVKELRAASAHLVA